MIFFDFFTGFSKQIFFENSQQKKPKNRDKNVIHKSLDFNGWKSHQKLKWISQTTKILFSIILIFQKFFFWNFFFFNHFFKNFSIIFQFFWQKFYFQSFTIYNKTHSSTAKVVVDLSRQQVTTVLFFRRPSCLSHHRSCGLWVSNPDRFYCNLSVIVLDHGQSSGHDTKLHLLNVMNISKLLTCKGLKTVFIELQKQLNVT